MLKTRVVNSLSKITYGRFNAGGLDNDRQDECAICLGSFEDD